MGKEENAGYQHFLLFSQCFQSALYFRVMKSSDYVVKSLPSIRRQILDSSKVKGLADDNFKFDENGRKFSKRVENNVGKGEIARYEQFLLFPQCFRKTYIADTLEPGLVWERVMTLFCVRDQLPCIDKFMYTVQNYLLELTILQPVYV